MSLQFTYNPFALGIGLDAVGSGGSGTSPASIKEITQTLIAGDWTTIIHSVGELCKGAFVWDGNDWSNMFPIQNPSGSTSQVKIYNGGPQITNASIKLIF